MPHSEEVGECSLKPLLEQTTIQMAASSETDCGRDGDDNDWHKWKLGGVVGVEGCFGS